MATIHDLPVPSFLKMSTEEQFTHIMAVRSRRRYVPPKATSTKTGGRQKAEPKPKSADDLLSMLSPEQAAKLLSELEG